MKRQSIGLVGVMSLLLISCNEDKTTQPGTGSIFATVKDASNSPVSGAIVLTDPPTSSKATDVLGTALLEHVPTGTYQIIATHSGIGSGKSVQVVQSGKVTNASIQLVTGVFLEPQVNIFDPASGAELSFVEPFIAKATVSDITDAPGALTLSWRSSRDGQLGTSPANANGLAQVSAPPLSLGQHWVYLKATNSQGLSGVDSIEVTVRSFSPEITIVEPAPNQEFVPGEAVHFQATITDRETAANQLQVVWTSDLDGVINSDAPDPNGAVDFTLTTLTRGVHQISVRATDTHQNSSTEALTVKNDSPQRVALALSKDMSSIKLAWPTVNEPEFQSFRIQRATLASGPFSLIDILNDPNAVQYTDSNIKFGQVYWYRVDLRVNSGSESQSNVVSVEAGISINVATQVEAMMVDPARPYLYALDRVNNSLLFVNLNTNTVEKTIFVGSSPVDLDIDDVGSEMYIANFGSSQIAVVNLETQAVARNLAVDVSGIWDGNPYRLAVLSNNRLVFTSEDQWNDLKVVDRTTGARIDAAESIYQPDLARSSDGTRFYAGESGISSSNLNRYEMVGNQVTRIDYTTYNSYTLRSVVVSGNDAYVFFAGHKYLANNLASDLGSFPEPIYASNTDGSVVIGEQRIYNGNTFTIIQDSPLDTRVMALAPGGETLYLYSSSNSRIYLFDLGSLSQ